MTSCIWSKAQTIGKHFHKRTGPWLRLVQTVTKEQLFSPNNGPGAFTLEDLAGTKREGPKVHTKQCRCKSAQSLDVLLNQVRDLLQDVLEMLFIGSFETRTNSSKRHFRFFLSPLLVSFFSVVFLHVH